jgi:hypothetical protein
MDKYNITPTKYFEEHSKLELHINKDILTAGLFKNILRDSEIVFILTAVESDTFCRVYFKSRKNHCLMMIGSAIIRFVISDNDFAVIMRRLTAKYKCVRDNTIKDNPRFIYKEIFIAPQEYDRVPSSLVDVCGASSQTIFIHMTDCKEHHDTYSPQDCDDYERNRALLLCYPQWSERIKEMSCLSNHWKLLVENWTMITELYNQDCKLCGEFFCHLREKKKIRIYQHKPQTFTDIVTDSSKAIFIHMMHGKMTQYNVPQNVKELFDNFELLYHYPEWIPRMPELGNFSKKWKNIVNNWDLLEQLMKNNEELCNSLLLELIK